MIKTKRLLIANISVIAIGFLLQALLFVLAKSSAIGSSGTSGGFSEGSSSASPIPLEELGVTGALVIAFILFVLWTVTLLVGSIITLAIALKKRASAPVLIVALLQQITCGLWVVILGYLIARGVKPALAAFELLNQIKSTPGFEDIAGSLALLMYLAIGFVLFLFFSFLIHVFLATQAYNEAKLAKTVTSDNTVNNVVNNVVEENAPKASKPETARDRKKAASNALAFKNFSRDAYISWAIANPNIECWTVNKVFNYRLEPAGQGLSKEVPKFEPERANIAFLNKQPVAIVVKTQNEKDYMFISPEVRNEEFFADCVTHLKSWYL